MRARAVSVHAQNEGTAREEGARRLSAAPDEVVVEAQGPGTYRAALRDADAEIGITVTPDGMEARVATYALPTGRGSSLSAEAISACNAGGTNL